MNRIILAGVLITFFNLKGMHFHFSAEDRTKVRIAVAKYIFQKQNGSPLNGSEDAVKESAVFQSLRNKMVVHEPNAAKASLIDEDAKIRYKVYLEKNHEVKEKPLPQS